MIPMSIVGPALGAMLIMLTGTAAGQEKATVRTPEEEAALADLRKLAGSMPPTPPKWAAAEVKDPATGATLTVYRTAEVAESLEAKKQLYVDALRRFPELQAYVEEAFALPTRSGLGGAGIVTKKDAEETWSLARRVTARLTSLSDLTVALGIRTLPVQGAAFTMRSAGGTKKEESPTNGTLKKVYRALYHYTITKSGYKPIAGSLDLVLYSTGVLRCTLVPTNVPTDPAPCAFEEL